MVGRTPSSARDPLVALFLSLSTLTPDTALGRLPDLHGELFAERPEGGFELIEPGGVA